MERFRRLTCDELMASHKANLGTIALSDESLVAASNVRAPGSSP